MRSRRISSSVIHPPYKTVSTRQLHHDGWWHPPTVIWVDLRPITIAAGGNRPSPAKNPGRQNRSSTIDRFFRRRGRKGDFFESPYEGWRLGDRHFSSPSILLKQLNLSLEWKSFLEQKVEEKSINHLETFSRTQNWNWKWIAFEIFIFVWNFHPLHRWCEHDQGNHYYCSIFSLHLQLIVSLYCREGYFVMESSMYEDEDPLWGSLIDPYFWSRCHAQFDSLAVHLAQFFQCISLL
jgi:hypothetical protein